MKHVATVMFNIYLFWILCGPSQRLGLHPDSTSQSVQGFQLMKAYYICYSNVSPRKLNIHNWKCLIYILGIVMKPENKAVRTELKKKKRN